MSQGTAEAAERNRRFEVLAQADGEPVRALAEAILADDAGLVVAIVTPPTPGVLMVRMREPVAGTVFNAGELLVTEAAVTVGGQAGHGMRLGREPETALAAAILDAAVAAGHPLVASIARLIEQEEADIAARERRDWDTVAATRVAFEEMHS